MVTNPTATNFFVYIARCADNTLYTGYTTDINRRAKEHNQGLGAKYTAHRRPVVIVYTEKCKSQSAAKSREYAIKKLTREAKQNLINQP